VPGTTESGIEGLEGDTVSGIVAPAGTSRGDHRQAQRRDQKGRRDGGYQGEARGAGFGVVASPPNEFGDRIKAEIVKWAKVIRDSNIKVD